jgi:uncharacterized protein YkwD
MGVRRLAVVAAAAQLLLLAFVSNASASVACPADQAQPSLDTAYDAAMAIVCDINLYRVQNGLRPLQWDWRLWRAAQDQANDMAANHYFAHGSSDGRSLPDRERPTGYIPNGPSWLLGENLGWGTSYLSTPLAIVAGWIDSPEHRENMLDPDFRDIGIGMNQAAISANGQSGMIYVADFGMREEPIVQPVTPAAKPVKQVAKLVARPVAKRVRPAAKRTPPADRLRLRGRAGRSRGR